MNGYTKYETGGKNPLYLCDSCMTQGFGSYHEEDLIEHIKTHGIYTRDAEKYQKLLEK